MTKRMTFEDFADLTAAQSRLGTIAEELATIRAKRAEIAAQIRNPSSGPLLSMAAAVARGETPDYANGPQAQLAELLERETVLNMAEGLARQAVDEQRRSALDAIWRNRGAAHRLIAARMATALEALAAATAEDHAFRDECHREGLGWRGPDSFGIHPRSYSETLDMVQAHAVKFREYAAEQITPSKPTASKAIAPSKPATTTTNEATVGELVAD